MLSSSGCRKLQKPQGKAKGPGAHKNKIMAGDCSALSPYGWVKHMAVESYSGAGGSQIIVLKSLFIATIWTIFYYNRYINIL